MSVAAVILLVLLVLSGVLAGLRGVGITHPRYDFGWLAVTLLIVVGIILVIERVSTL